MKQEDPHIAEWTAEMPLPEWAKNIPGPDLVHSWCALVAQTSAGRVENYAWYLGSSENPEAFVSVYLIRQVNLAEYISPGVARFAQILAKMGWHPFELDIAFCELPLLHLPGFIVSPDTTPERRLVLWRAVLQKTRQDLDVPLFAARVLPDWPEAKDSDIPYVPFISSYVLQLPSGGWKNSLPPFRRHKISYLERRLLKRNGRAEIFTTALPDAETLNRLYQLTVQNNADSLQHPVHVGPELLAKLHTLPSDRRWIVGIEVEGELAAFCLALRTGDRLLLRTGGVDPVLSRPVHGYFQVDFVVIPFAESIGCQAVDMGPTSEDIKTRLGAVAEPTAYLMDFRHWLLLPLRFLLSLRFKAESDLETSSNTIEHEQN
ncbi:MAG: GNAT family N-acetyltransferase [Spirulina sp. SIO3F2]|nr:GNAT family N-acetyltransferase [Spirulina sp. SIO3F2]